MGHANLSNLCDLFINLLYARGKLTIGEAVEVAGKRGETLHASEGEYDAESGMVGMALEQYCSFLVCDASRAQHDYGWRYLWEGPFIEPLFDPYGLRPKPKPKRKVFRVTAQIRGLLDSCVQHPMDAPRHSVAADALEEAGQEKWSAYVRELPTLRDVYRRWADQGDDTSDLWETIDRIPWRFLPGWRRLYFAIPRIGNYST